MYTCHLYQFQSSRGNIIENFISNVIEKYYIGIPEFSFMIHIMKIKKYIIYGNNEKAYFKILIIYRLEIMSQTDCIKISYSFDAILLIDYKSLVSKLYFNMVLIIFTIFSLILLLL